ILLGYPFKKAALHAQALYGQLLNFFVHQILPSQTGKPHIVPPIVVPASWDDAVRSRDLHFLLQIVQGVQIDFLIVHETDRITDLPVFHTGGNLFYEALAQIVVYIQFRIPGNLDHMRRYGLKIEHGEDIVQAIPDQIVKDHDVVLIPFFGKDHKTIDSLGYFDQGISDGIDLPCTIFHHDLDRQIGGRILEQGKFRELVQDNGHQFRMYLLEIVIPYELPLGLTDLGLIDIKDVLLFELFFNFAEVIQAPGLLIDNDLGDLLQKILGTFSAQNTFPGLARIHYTFDRGIPHLEKFVQVIAENPQEPHAVDQGYTFVIAFLEYPCIEMQPTDLPVNILFLCLYHLLAQLFGEQQVFDAAR